MGCLIAVTWLALLAGRGRWSALPGVGAQPVPDPTDEIYCDRAFTTLYNCEVWECMDWTTGWCIPATWVSPPPPR